MLFRNSRSDRSRGIGSLLLVAFTALRVASADASWSDEVENSFVALHSINEEVFNTIAAARLEMGERQEREGWPPDQIEDAQLWLNGFTAARPFGTARRPRYQPAGEPIRQVGPVAAHNLAAPAKEFGDQIFSRLTALAQWQSSGKFFATDAIATEVERIWLAARDPADLQPAIALMQRLKAEVLDFLPKPILSSLGGPFPFPGVLGDGRRVILFGEDAQCLTLLLSGPEPLFLPDPETDPAGYVRFRLTWQNLAAWKLSIMMHWRVQCRIQECDQRFAQAALRSRNTLDELLIHPGPAEEITKAAAQLELFRVPRVPRGFPNTFSNSAVRDVTDYRKLALLIPSLPANLPPPSSPFQPALNPEVLDAYRVVAAALSSIVARSADAASAQNVIRNKLSSLPSADLRASLESRLGGDGPQGLPDLAQFTANENAAPEATLIQLLDSVAKKRRDDAGSAAELLAESWRQFSAGSNLSAGRNSEPTENLWSRLTKVPGSTVIFTYRDLAVRHLLAGNLPAAVEIRSGSLLQAAWEKVVANSDWKQCQHLLALARLTSLLPEKEQKDWQRDLDNLVQAERWPGRAPEIYRGILAQTVSPTVANLAARRLKESLQKAQ